MARATKLKKPNLTLRLGNRVKLGSCWGGFIIVPDPPCCWEWQEMEGAGRRQTLLHSQRFNCTQIPLPLHKCHILSWSGGIAAIGSMAGKQPDDSAESVQPIRTLRANRGEHRDRRQPGAFQQLHRYFAKHLFPAVRSFHLHADEIFEEKFWDFEIFKLL